MGNKGEPKKEWITNERYLGVGVRDLQMGSVKGLIWKKIMNRHPCVPFFPFRLTSLKMMGICGLGAQRRLFISWKKLNSMFRFFDFLYYSIHRFYSEGKDNNPEFAASCGVAGVQAFNIYSLIILYERVGLKLRESIVSIFPWVAIMLLLIILNYIRYIRIDKYSFDSIKKRWDAKDDSNKVRYRMAQAIYLILSGILFFALIFYFASKKM
jgi:hypothetical protein